MTNWQIPVAAAWVVGLFAVMMVIFWAMVPAHGQATTHRWRDCHFNSSRQQVCRECWLEDRVRRCTRPVVVTKVSS